MQPYGEWLRQQRHDIHPQRFNQAYHLDAAALLRQQTAFGYTAEDLDMIIQDMAAQGKEPTYCMGDDTPLAILSDKPHLLYNYFKQRFAQVTNPAIDPLRERLVMSLVTQLGGRGNLLAERPEFAHQLKLSSPVVNEQELALIRQSDLETATLSTLYPFSQGLDGLEKAVDSLCQQATAAVEAGKRIVILSDLIDAAGADTHLGSDLIYIPPLLAIGAVHHHLIGQRTADAGVSPDGHRPMLEHPSFCLLNWLWGQRRLSLSGVRECSPLVGGTQKPKN